MSARDDYPYLVHLAGASEAARDQAQEVLDEIDRLRADSRDADVLEMENRNLRELLIGLGVTTATIDACAERVPH